MRLPSNDYAFSLPERQAVYRAIHERRDMRHFSGGTVPDALLQRLLSAAHHAPSVGFMQPWRFIRVRSQPLRESVHALVEQERVLTAQALGERVIETLAENLNDSVVAPIFWFVLFGLPGAAVYRFANTADAMWGYRGTYKGQHWEWAGKWAAHADDALSWLPARLTGWLLMGVTGNLWPGTLRREAARTPSPNSGWPMAAMALALGVSVSKPGVYTLNATGRAPQAEEVLLAKKYASKVVFAQAECALAAIIFVAILWR